SDLRWFDVEGIRLPFRRYAVSSDDSPLFVFYCLWNDRDQNESFSAMSLSYLNRLKPVLEGKRNLGQRSLEVAVWGISDGQNAEVAFEDELKRLVNVEPQ